VRRHGFVSLLGVALLMLAPLPLVAQQSSKIWLIGILETTSIALNAPNLEAFRRGLRDLGYVEGKNLTIEYRSAEGYGERFAELAADLLRLNVDVIVTRGTPAVLAGKKATTTTPIVMAAMGDPLMIISSLAHPSGNITGMSGYTNDLEAKRAEVIKELVPGAVRIAGLYNMGNPVVPMNWNELRTAAQRLGFEPQLMDARKQELVETLTAICGSTAGRALLVDDDEVVRRSVRQALEPIGWQVIEAKRFCQMMGGDIGGSIGVAPYRTPFELARLP
jgi:putative ABC transport system substrate-binding protein